MALHHNESETTKAIKEAKTLCTHTTKEAEAHQAMLISKAETWYATCIKEAKANCASIIAEAKNCCSVVIRKAESHGTKQACSIQQSHAEGMQHLEMEAIGEEGKDCLSFLATCWAFGPATSKTMGLGDPLPSPLRECTLVHSTKCYPHYLLLNMNLSHKLLMLLPP